MKTKKHSCRKSRLGKKHASSLILALLTFGGAAVGYFYKKALTELVPSYIAAVNQVGLKSVVATPQGVVATIALLMLCYLTLAFNWMALRHGQELSRRLFGKAIPSIF